MAATARWLERVVRAICVRDEARVFDDRSDDASTLRSLVELTLALEPYTDLASVGRTLANDLLIACDREGRLPAARAMEVQRLIAALESNLA